MLQMSMMVIGVGKFENSKRVYITIEDATVVAKCLSCLLAMPQLTVQ